ncbi:MAG: VanZ family protein [Betaproteobacteria bacterium]
MRPFWIAGGWAILAGIVYLSLTPSPPSPDFESSDKLGHLLAYGVLMAWFALLYPARKPFLAAAFIALGIALELAQGALGYRSLELADMVANSLGIALGWGGAALARRALA